MTLLKKSSRVAACLLFLSITLLLPNQGWSQQETAEQGQHIELTEAQIASFTRAHVQIEYINQNYQQQLAAVTNQQEQQKIVEEANEKMINVIQAEGLSIGLYNAIVQQVPNDPALQSRIAQEMQNLQTR